MFDAYLDNDLVSLDTYKNTFIYLLGNNIIVLSYMFLTSSGFGLHHFYCFFNFNQCFSVWYIIENIIFNLVEKYITINHY